MIAEIERKNLRDNEEFNICLYVFPAGMSCLTFWGLFRSLCRSLKDGAWRTRVQRSPVWCVFGVFLLLDTVRVSLEFCYRSASAGGPGWKSPGQLPGGGTQRLPGRAPVLAGQLGASLCSLGAPGAAAPVAVRGQRGQTLSDPARCGASVPGPGQNCRATELQNHRTAETQNCRTTEQQNYRTTELRNYRTTELQKCKTAELQNSRITEPQNCRTTEQQNSRTAEQQNYRTTSPGGLWIEGTAGPGRGRPRRLGKLGRLWERGAHCGPARSGPVRPGR